MAGLPPAGSALKPMAKFLQQAKSIERVDAVVAHYLRLYALQVGMKVPNRTPSDLQFLGSVMASVEASANQPSVKALHKDDARAKCEAFALQVFEHGDTEDRAGLASKKTALNFHAAYVLLESCRQFGPLASDVEEKLKYAIVKAADINKALKEGRKPKAGPLNEPSDDELLASLGGPDPNAPISSPASAPPPMAGASGFGDGSAGGSNWPSASASAAAAPSSFNPHAAGPSFPSLGGGAGDGGFVDASAPDVSASAPPAAAYHQPQPQQSTPSLPWNRPSSSSSAASSSASSSSAASSSSSSSASGSGWPAKPASHSPFSPEARAARAAAAASGGGGGSGSMSFGHKDPRRSEAIREGERLIKHALSSIVFSDVDTACQKMRDALALLEPFQTALHQQR